MCRGGALGEGFGLKFKPETLSLSDGGVVTAKQLVKPIKNQVQTLDGQNRQSPIASVQRTRSTLASHSAIRRGTNVNE